MILRLFGVMILASMTAFSQGPPIEAGVSKALAEWRAAHYSDVRYKLNLTLEKMSPVLKGTIETRVNVSEPPASAGGQSAGGESPQIILDWRKIAGHEKDSTISNVTVNGKPMEVRGGGAFPVDMTTKPYIIEDREHLIIGDGVKMGENVIKLDFTSPILTSGSAITRYVDKEDGAEYIYSLFVPSDASTAFPVFDQPDLKARFKLSVKAPHEWRIVSNGLPNMLWTGDAAEFFETKPISSYVFAFAAGDFKAFTENFSDKGLGNGSCDPCDARKISEDSRTYSGNYIYIRKSQAEKFRPYEKEVFPLEREAVKYLETYFDYKFPFPKYDLVLIPEFPFGGMEHAGATFLRESAVIFPSEPTKSDYISRATLIFHETAHQWFGDTVTMKWFDDLWLKEGFANFMAYKALEKIMPEANAWKVFYERIKQPAYATDSTRGTTAIYQPIANLSAAKSAYGNIVYNKAPAFLRQAEFYLGEDKFQTAVRAFLKKHEYGNTGWEDLVKEFEAASGSNLKDWANSWATKPGMTLIKISPDLLDQKWSEKWKFSWTVNESELVSGMVIPHFFWPSNIYSGNTNWYQSIKVLRVFDDDFRENANANLGIGYFSQGDIKRLTKPISPNSKPELLPLPESTSDTVTTATPKQESLRNAVLIFPNFQDYGYGIFLLDDKSRDYVLNNIQNEKDPFLRSMMWGSLWDSVREGELDPRVYVELVIKQLGGEPLQKPARSKGTAAPSTTPSAAKNTAATPPIQGGEPRGTLESDETIIQSLLGRASTALNYYIPTDDSLQKPDREGGRNTQRSSYALANARASATSDLRTRLQSVLIDRMQNAATAGERITFYRAFVANAVSEKGRTVLKELLTKGGNASSSERVQRGTASNSDTLPTGRVSASGANIPLRTKDKFDIVTRLAVLGDADAPKLLADLEKTETGDDAKRYAYAAHAAFATKENREKFWNDFVNNKDISESWIEAAIGPFNSIRHDDLSLPYLERALKELPNLKRNRKIFFVNGWLGAFIGGQRSQAALDIVNKFLTDNPQLDNDLRLKILENVDIIERAVRIRAKFKKI